jgi:hypothetical protein
MSNPSKNISMKLLMNYKYQQNKNTERLNIENIKAHIRNNKKEGVWGGDYQFRKAIQELRTEGLNIKYNRSKFCYILEG